MKESYPYLIGIAMFLIFLGYMAYLGTKKTNYEKYEDCKNTELRRGFVPDYDGAIKICQPFLDKK